jgi:hypothetical protein
VTPSEGALPRDSASILRKVRQTLDMARRGLRDFGGNEPDRRLPGLRNLIVFGRAVTNVLQTLRGVDRDAFEEWYGPKQQEMQGDPLMRFFVALRNQILKEGGPDTTTSMHVGYLDTRDLQPLLANPPSGAGSLFIGDETGGSGWEVHLPDGSIEKYYVQLPDTIDIESQINLPEPPKEHLGKSIADTSTVNLGRLYLDYLSGHVAEAEDRFVESAGDT